MPEPIWIHKSGPAFDRTETTHGYTYKWVYNTFTADWQRLRREGWEFVSGDPTRSQWRRWTGTGASATK